jgi:hypothetical protein
MTTTKPSTLLPQCGTLGGVLLLLSILPLEQKPHSTILITPAPGLQKKLTIHGDATTAKVTTTMRRKKATPALEHPATVDGAKDKDISTLMQLKCPPEVETQQNATTEVTPTLPQLKDPPVIETWQHGTPDATLTLLRLKEAPEIDTLQHATASSIASHLKDDNDYNSCVEWAVAAASAGCNAECDSYVKGRF